MSGSLLSLDCCAAPGHISHLAVAGVGLWVASYATSTVALYHTESFIHMQDVDIATNVQRVLAAREVGTSKRSIYVTALSAAKGLLWVGTNVGIALTIPLPRLEGVPIISGKANISYHAHFGPVRMFLPLQPRVHPTDPLPPPLSRRQALPDAPTTIQEEPGETKPNLVKQVTAITTTTTCCQSPPPYPPCRYLTGTWWAPPPRPPSPSSTPAPCSASAGTTHH